MNVAGASLTLLFSLAAFVLPRRWAAVAIFAGTCYITQGQSLVVGGFHFFAFRIVLLAGFIRILTRGDIRRLKLEAIDKILLAYAIYSCVVCSLRSGACQEQIGLAYNILLSYFTLRCLVTNLEEAQEFALGAAMLIVPLAVFMLQESVTNVNFFSGMGGQAGQDFREGRLRCIGAFRGPHTAGCFGATLMPLFVGLYFNRAHKRIVVIAGFLAATAITYTSNSSGPLLAFLSGLVAFAFWPLREKMRRVRWAILISLIVLDMVMKPPIWYILSKVADITGGDGWYRSYLMEQCYNHFGDWWLMGTDNTSQWAATLLPTGGADLCNIFVSCAAYAGLGCLWLFTALLVKSFSNLGKALQRARGNAPENQAFLWCVGCALFAHVMALCSVTYWDQMQVDWWAFLAIIASATTTVLSPTESSEQEVIDVEAHAVESTA